MALTPVKKDSARPGAAAAPGCPAWCRTDHERHNIPSHVSEPAGMIENEDHSGEAWSHAVARVYGGAQQPGVLVTALMGRFRLRSWHDLELNPHDARKIAGIFEVLATMEPDQVRALAAAVLEHAEIAGRLAGR